MQRVGKKQTQYSESTLMELVQKGAELHFETAVYEQILACRAVRCIKLELSPLHNWHEHQIIFMKGLYSLTFKHFFFPSWDNSDFYPFTNGDLWSGAGMPACLSGLQRSLVHLQHPAMSVEDVFLSVEKEQIKTEKKNFFYW